MTGSFGNPMLAARRQAGQGFVGGQAVGFEVGGGQKNDGYGQRAQGIGGLDGTKGQLAQMVGHAEKIFRQAPMGADDGPHGGWQLAHFSQQPFEGGRSCPGGAVIHLRRHAAAAQEDGAENGAHKAPTSQEGGAVGDEDAIVQGALAAEFGQEPFGGMEWIYQYEASDAVRVVTGGEQSRHAAEGMTYEDDRLFVANAIEHGEEFMIHLPCGAGRGSEIAPAEAGAIVDRDAGLFGDRCLDIAPTERRSAEAGFANDEGRGGDGPGDVEVLFVPADLHESAGSSIPPAVERGAGMLD